jgi:excisionase family DNA binding protein
MSATPADLLTPTPSDAEDLARVLSFIEAHEARHGTAPSSAYFLAGVDEHDRVELTEQLHTVLKQVVLALSQGQSISILTREQEISTQQAAEILGLSRPTVVRLVDSGEIPAHVPGAVRRRLRLADVLAYREMLRARRNQFISDSSEAFVDADAAELADLTKQARRATPVATEE